MMDFAMHKDVYTSFQDFQWEHVVLVTHIISLIQQTASAYCTIATLQVATALTKFLQVLLKQIWHDSLFT